MATNPIEEMARLREACQQLCDVVANCCPTDTWLYETPCQRCLQLADEACEIQKWASSAESKAKMLGLLCRVRDCDGAPPLDKHGLCKVCSGWSCPDCGTMLGRSEMECEVCKQGTWLGHADDR